MIGDIRLPHNGWTPRGLIRCGCGSIHKAAARTRFTGAPSSEPLSQSTRRDHSIDLLDHNGAAYDRRAEFCAQRALLAAAGSSASDTTGRSSRAAITIDVDLPFNGWRGRVAATAS